jgi:hypothetical protein
MGSSLGPASLNDGLWVILQPIVVGRGQMAYGPSLKMGDDLFSDRHRVGSRIGYATARSILPVCGSVQ